jgi:uncharacterized protein
MDNNQENNSVPQGGGRTTIKLFVTLIFFLMVFYIFTALNAEVKEKRLIKEGQIKEGEIKERQTVEQIPMVHFASTTVFAIIAHTGAARERGLGGVEALHPSQGMLFVFDTPDMYSFWMKDMHFAIDIMWIDDTFTIVDMIENIKPESYPKIFKTDKKARFVLETAAGFVRKNSVHIGDSVVFEGVLEK